MIRLFTSLCKSVLKKLSDESIFKEAASGYRYYSERCPKCGTVGKLSPYGNYSRNLVFHDGEKVIESIIHPPRFKCVSCGVTHTLLPDIIIPYSPYSLRFILTVLVAYFERITTVQEVCAYYGIAVSTLYAWKHRMIENKDLLLGMLGSQKEPVKTFVRNLLASACLSKQLSDFFSRYAFSFLQNFSKATCCKPP